MQTPPLGMSGAYEASLAGISRGMARVNGAAVALADGPDIHAMADLKLGELQVKASVRTARTVDDTLGSLLDMLA